MWLNFTQIYGTSSGLYTKMGSVPNIGYYNTGINHKPTSD